YVSFEELWKKEGSNNQTVNNEYSEEMPRSPQLTSRQVDSVVTTHFNTPGLSNTVTVSFGEDVPNVEQDTGIVLIRANQERGLMDRDLLLSRNKAQLTFSTKGIVRHIDIKKKDDGEEVDDVERQEQFDKEFMKIKHILGLGRRGQTHEKVAINYSISWHYIEMKIDGKIERFDLLDKRDIEKILVMRGLDADAESVKAVYKDLLAANREMRRITKRETGTSTGGVFVHDYVGNPQGSDLFKPLTEQSEKVMRLDESHGKYVKTMERFGMVTRKPGNLFKKDQIRLTKKGADALNQAEKTRVLQKKIIDKLVAAYNQKEMEYKQLKGSPPNIPNHEIRAQLGQLSREMKEIHNAYVEIAYANKTVIDFTLLELNRDFKHREDYFNGEDELVSKIRTQTGHQLLQPLNSVNQRKDVGIRGNDERGARRREFERRDQMSDQATKDFEKMLSEENRARPGLFRSKQDHVLSPSDKAMAREVGQMVHQLAGGTRLQHLESSLRTGLTVHKEPRVEKLLLNIALDPNTDDIDEEDLGSFGVEHSSPVVQGLVASAINDYKGEVRKQMIPQPFAQDNDYFDAVKHLK
ncbi:MAG: hypothetical protein KDK60_01950, partial [Chlamydiia bacterium]|nr:hypothetical protein [Chlamydiia bacterium]